MTCMSQLASRYKVAESTARRLLRQAAESALTVTDQAFHVHREGRPPQAPPLQLRPAHPRSHPLHDQVALQFADGGDDYRDRPAQRPARVQLLPEADELHPQAVQLVQGFQKVADAAGQPVAAPD